MVVKGVRNSIKNVATYVQGNTVEDIKEKHGLNSISKLCFNENPYAPYSVCKKAIKENMDSYNCYPEEDYIKLKEMIAQKNNFSSNNIALGHGIVGLLETLSKMFLEKDDQVIIPESTFGLYEDLSRIMGAEIVKSELDQGKVDVEDVVDNINSKTKIIWISNPNNPTGTIINDDEFQYLLSNLPEDVWLIFDEAYYEFAVGPDYPASMEAVRDGANIILTRTFSKAYGMAGLRLGYAIANKEVIEIINRVSQPFNSNRAGLKGAKAILENGKEADQALKKINKSKEHLISELQKRNLEVFPSYTNFIFFKTPYSAKKIAGRMLKDGVMVAEGSRWGYEKGIRVSIGKPENNKIFLNSLDKTLDELN